MMDTLAHRIKLPRYSLREELFNSISHGIGALAGVLALALMAAKATTQLTATCACLFGASIVITYTVSCVYHALPASAAAKRVMRVIDHCSVFLLVFGTYIPASLLGVGGPLGWALFGVVAALTTVGIVLSVIDVDRFSKAAVACHLVSGWSFLVGLPTLLASCGLECAALVVGGGVAYTVGAILYGLGRNYTQMHCVFHVFCLMGTLMQFLAIYTYML